MYCKKPLIAEYKFKYSCVGANVSTTPALGTVSPGTSVRACDFEANNICGFLQDTTDNFNWTQTTKATATIGTGPSNDHTYGTSNGIF